MTIEDLARRMDAAIGNLPTKMEMGSAINTAVGNLAIIVQKEFVEVNKIIRGLNDEINGLPGRITALEKEMKGMYGNFDMVFQQLKEIRDQLKDVDSPADVVDLQIRVGKLEKKVKDKN